MKKRSYFRMFLFIIISITALVLMIFLNDITTHLHIKELKVLIQKRNKEESNLNHVNLIINYKINKKLYENEMTQNDADLKELRSNILLLNEIKNKQVNIEKYPVLSYPVLKMINFMRYFIGKEPLREFEDFKMDSYLALAYYYERNKKYSQALEVYDKSLSESKNDLAKTAPILLHKGFCLAILNETDKARKIYSKIIKDFTKDDIVLTAMVLLKFLDGFELEKKRVLSEEKDEIEKSEKLYKLLAYQESIKVLNSLEDKIPPSQKSRVRFLKGRSLEELGEKESALKSYLSLIQDDPKSDYAKSANSRIFIMSTREYGGEKLKQLALKNNETLKDEKLNQMMDEYSSLSIDPNQYYEQFKNTPISAELTKDYQNNNKINETDQARQTDPTQLKEEVKENENKIIEKSQPAVKKEIDPQKEKQVSVSETKPTIKPKPVRIQIITKKGDRMTGELINESKDQIIIRISLGEIKINKSDIASRKKIE